MNLSSASPCEVKCESAEMEVSNFPFQLVLRSTHVKIAGA